MKAAIVVLSDPKAGTEEALGRLFNALAQPMILSTVAMTSLSSSKEQELAGLGKL